MIPSSLEPIISSHSTLNSIQRQHSCVASSNPTRAVNEDNEKRTESLLLSAVRTLFDLHPTDHMLQGPSFTGSSVSCCSCRNITERRISSCKTSSRGIQKQLKTSRNQRVFQQHYAQSRGQLGTPPSPQTLIRGQYQHHSNSSLDSSVQKMMAIGVIVRSLFPPIMKSSPPQPAPPDSPPSRVSSLLLPSFRQLLETSLQEMHDSCTQK